MGLQIIFEGVRGFNVAGDISIDDVELRDQNCDLPGSKYRLIYSRVEIFSFFMKGYRFIHFFYIIALFYVFLRATLVKSLASKDCVILACYD